MITKKIYCDNADCKDLVAVVDDDRSDLSDAVHAASPGAYFKEENGTAFCSSCMDAYRAVSAALGRRDDDDEGEGPEDDEEIPPHTPPPTGNITFEFDGMNALDSKRAAAWADWYLENGPRGRKVSLNARDGRIVDVDTARFDSSLALGKYLAELTGRFPAFYG